MSQALDYLLRFLAFNPDDAPLIAPRSQQGRNASICHKIVTNCTRMVTRASLPHEVQSDHNNDNNGSPPWPFASCGPADLGKKARS